MSHRPELWKEYLVTIGKKDYQRLAPHLPAPEVGVEESRHYWQMPGAAPRFDY
jgi:hypothetical protein